MAYLEHEHAVGGAGKPDVSRGFSADNLVAGQKAASGPNSASNTRSRIVLLALVLILV